MLKLPIGYDNFRKIRERGLDFVDKSLFIKEIIDDIGTEVAVISRPRRFGKTLNLSMLHHFLADKVYNLPTKNLFHSLKITKAGNAYMQHQGKYPVIFLSFKDVKGSRFEHAYKDLCELISSTYRDHSYLLNGNTLDLTQKNKFESIISETADLKTIQSSLRDLCEYLAHYYDTKPWLLIDEYDTPLQSAYLHNYYDEMIETMRSIFSKALKTNAYLYRSVITGILRIAKESLFSGVNNLQVYSLLRPEYSEHFGFTEHEVNDLLEKTELQSKASEIKEWYNGYQIGNTVLYNPWSIVSCIKNSGKVGPYWVNTSGNDLIRSLIIESDDEFKDQLNILMRGESIQKTIDENIVFLDLKGSNMAIWSLLLLSGYLKIISEKIELEGIQCQLVIPNREIRSLYHQIITQWISKGKGIDWMRYFINALLDGNIEAFENSLTDIMEQTVSFHDTSNHPEAFYHGMLIGLTAILYNNPNYTIISNRESGTGRYDYMILSKDKTKPTIIFELKRSKSEAMLSDDSENALAQIQHHCYFTQAQQSGSLNIICIGLAFYKKDFCMKHDFLKS